MSSPTERDAAGFFIRGQEFASTGRIDQAAQAYREAIAADPRFVPALFALGQVERRRGDYWSAEAHLAKALALSAHDSAARDIAAAAMADLLGSLSFDRYAAERDDELKLCLETPSVDAQHLAAVLARHLMLKYPAILDDPKPVARDPLWIALLTRTVNVDAEMEQLLTRLRRELLVSNTGANGLSQTVARIIPPLALQAFAGEYVWPVTPDEQALLGQSAPLLLASLYAPLRALTDRTGAHRLKRDRLTRLLVRRTFDDLAREAELAEAMPSLAKPGSDSVAGAVRQQYEENPYPRWLAPPAPRREPLGDLLARTAGLNRSILPHRPHSVLIAGCGTGYEAVGLARTDPELNLTAIDLSRASLAHAARLADETEISNARFFQADLRDIGLLGESFDVIYSTGVLHHMAEPADGLRALAGVLTPGGAMRLGLYSRRARAPVNAARALIAARGWPATPEGVRAFRAHVLALPDSDTLSALRHGKDFFSLSGCRDLVFHVQEHQFDLHEIASMLKDAGLIFASLDPPADVRAQFATRFGESADQRDLGMWDQLEAEDTTLFAGMYLIWCQKPR